MARRVVDDLGRARVAGRLDPRTNVVGLPDPAAPRQIGSGRIDQQAITIGEVRAMPFVDGKVPLRQISDNEPSAGVVLTSDRRRIARDLPTLWLRKHQPA